MLSVSVWKKNWESFYREKKLPANQRRTITLKRVEMIKDVYVCFEKIDASPC